ncbi:reverse transcriptase domain-containing protein [Tanacetum coccineum]|uniref:Reverse transcriptase domain-containing protein n=1 Tax=Tanacetum coccineum TaxID=301880 RepID=A0ABQ5DSZ8_9ASTR
MTYIRDNLVNFDEYDGNNALLGDSREYHIRGTGTVRVHMRDGLSFVLDNIRDTIENGLIDKMNVTLLAKFEVEEKKDHAFESEPRGNVNQGSCDVSWKKTEEYTKIWSLNEEVNSNSSFPTPVHCFGHNLSIRTPFDAIQATTERGKNYLQLSFLCQKLKMNRNLDDQPMWESAKTVAPTPNSVIVQPDVDDNFVINSTHLKMIWENKFDGYLRADPHDHIREFLAICDMFKYGETQSEAVKLLMFPLSLCDDARYWFDELNEESITSWDQMRRAFISRFFPPSLFERLLLELEVSLNSLTKEAIIQIFYHGLDKPTQAILDGTAGEIFLYKTPNQSFQLLEDKVLFKLDWSTKSQNKHHQKSVASADGSENNNDNSQLMEKLEALIIKMILNTRD